MKIYFILIAILIFLPACDQDNIPQYRRFNDMQCGGGGRGSVSLDDLPTIDYNNVDDYEMSGKCERDRNAITIHIEGHPLSQQPICNRGRWKTAADITAIVAHKERIQIAVSQGSSQSVLCQQIVNNFLCPQNYVPIPKLINVADGIDTDTFCVMKFEAKIQQGDRNNRPFTPSRNPVRGFLAGPQLPNNPQRFANPNRGTFGIRAVSTANGTLARGVNTDTAMQYCRENGAGYDLISNREWQTIARHIEMTPSNWSEGTLNIKSGNFLNVGHVGQTPISVSNTDDEQTQRWTIDRRIHQLINGAYIWDFSGNLWEVVQHDISAISTTFSGYVYQMPTELKKLFGPRRDYSVFQPQDRIQGRGGGLGFIQAGTFKGGILRGGGGGSNQWKAGVFSTDTTRLVRNSRARIPTIGMRCVFHP